MKVLRNILLLLFIYLIFTGVQPVKANNKSEVTLESIFGFEQDFDFSNAFDLLETVLDEIIEDSDNEYCLLIIANIKQAKATPCTFIFARCNQIIFSSLISVRYTNLPPPQNFY